MKCNNLLRMRNCPNHDTEVQFTVKIYGSTEIITETQSRVHSSLGVWQNSGDYGTPAE